MDISINYKWLREYIDTELNAIEFAKAVTPYGILIEKWKFDSAIQDYILESEVTSNRVDLASVIGIAREYSGIFNKKIRLPSVKILPKTKDIKIEVKIQTKDCKRYQALVIDNIKVEPSPKWMQEKLLSVGINPINNLVGISNYVLIEYGQPTHIFDYDTVSDGKIIVRKAFEKEIFTTLDGIEKILDPKDIVIADEKKVLGLAGIKGGQNSGVTNHTKTIIIESANFDSVVVRRSSRKHNIKTDASSLFEKRLPEELSNEGIQRVASLICEICKGQIASDILDEKSNFEEKTKIIKFNPNLVKKILGIDISEEKINEYLDRLGFKVDKDNLFLNVQVPYYRKFDILQDFDLVEEVARLYGYQNVPSRLLSSQIPTGEEISSVEKEIKSKKILVNMGFAEIFTRALISNKLLDFIGFDPQKAMEVFNPLSEEFKYLRPKLTPAILNVASENFRLEEDLYLFELNQIFVGNNIKSELPEEKTNLSMLICKKNQHGIYQELKSEFEKFVYLNGGDEKMLKYIPISQSNYLKQGYSSEIFISNKKIGEIGILNDETKKKIDIQTHTVGIIEIDFEELNSLQRKLTFKQIPIYQSVNRDITLLISKNIFWHEIKDYISSLNIKFLESFYLIDEFESEKFDKSEKSLTIRFNFLSNEKTLVESEVSDPIEFISKSLMTFFNAKIR